MISSTESQRAGILTPTPRKSTFITEKYEVGDCVEITQSRVAIIKYIGRLREHRGTWYGIEFIDGSVGSHNGTFKNTFYFVGTDKRCEFIQKGDIRRRFKTKAQSARNIFHDANESMVLNQDGSNQPQINLNKLIASQKTVNAQITLKLRCMCFADPAPIEIKIDINQQTMRHLKKQIINECNTKTKLALFKSTIDARSYCDAVELYRLTTNNRKHRSNLNVKAGNMTHCILKKNSNSFKKLTVNNNDDGQNNVPLKYYKIKDGEQLFVLFKFNVNIKIMFQKSLFVHNESKDNPEQKLCKVISDSDSYTHEHVLNVNFMDKCDALYLKLMNVTGISNINAIKLLSNTFIYNKSMWIEKFICNEMDEDDDIKELFLYFVHLHENDVNHMHNNRTTKGAHHVSRTRNYSLMSNYSTFGTLDGMQSVSNRAGANFMHHPSANNIINSNKYIKVLLNFVTAKKSESYTIVDDEQTIKLMRTAISYRYNIECDAIKLNNIILDDKKLIKECNINTNDILHIFDEQEITIHITQSVSSGIDSKKMFDVKMNKKRTIKHVKYEISRILRYPMVSQTLIMKDVLDDAHLIEEIGIKDGDTLRLVYNFGKRVRKLPNSRIKIPISTFNTNKKFDMIVNKDIFIYEIMEMIQKEKGVDSRKQQLLFHGVVLDKEQRLDYYNITHEIHLLIVKNKR